MIDGLIRWSLRNLAIPLAFAAASCIGQVHECFSVTTPGRGRARDATAGNMGVRLAEYALEGATARSRLRLVRTYVLSA